MPPTPQEYRMMAVIERQANAHWTYVALAWAAQQGGDAAGAMKALLAMRQVFAAMCDYTMSGAYLKARPLGVHTKHKGLDDDRAHAFMIETARRTGEQRGETLGRMAFDAGLTSRTSPEAAKKRLAKWWREQKAKN